MTFRDLRVWQIGMELVVEVYRLTQSFPRHEIYGLTSQMQRAAVSIPSNIAECHTREHTREFLQHISVAQGSLAELQTQVEIAVQLRYVAASNLQRFNELSMSLSKQLCSLRNVLNEKVRAKATGNPTPCSLSSDL